MFHVKSLATCLKGLSQNKIISDIALRHRRKLFCKYDSIWHEFPTSGDIIIPFQYAADYAQKHNLQLDEPAALHSIDFHYLNRTVQKVPIVAILGHFNHGKTTLIDYYGNTNLVKNEIHAITQVIRSRMLSLNPQQRVNFSLANAAVNMSKTDDMVTFVDTPGQEIFYRMRDYGAAIADVALLVVSADDGICQQTEESIGILESLAIPVVVCINKIDLPAVSSNPNRVAEVEAQARQFEALENSEFVPISAKYGTNIVALSDRIREVIRISNLAKPGNASSDSSERVRGMFICGTGTVLNIWNSRQTGTVLHLIMQHGVVAVGEHFSAGGWCGVVRKIVHDNQTAVSSARAGMGVHLTVVLSKLIAEPRPLGDRIYFHGPQPGSRDRQMTKQTKSDMDKYRTAAEGVMVQHQLQARIGSYAISDATAAHYRLEDAHERVKNSVEYHRKRALVAEGQTNEVGEAEESVTSDSGAVEEEEEEEEDPLECRVVVKADTDLSLGTIMDAHDEATARFEAGSVDRRPNRVVFSGVGDVTVRDVTIAQAANALIVTYGVSIEPEAARLSAQNGGIRMLGLDCMQTAVNAVVFVGEKNEVENAQLSFVRKPKRRDTSHD